MDATLLTIEPDQFFRNSEANHQRLMDRMRQVAADVDRRLKNVLGEWDESDAISGLSSSRR